MLDVKRNLTTMTDFYELTMSAGYLDEGYVDKIAVFDMFFRRVPDGGGYAIMAGLQQFIDAVDHLKFTKEDIEYLRSTNTFNEKFLTYLENFKLHCNIWAIEEGMPIFPQEPIVTVEGPAIECQLLETLLLVTFNHQCLIATKANRIVRSAAGRPVMEFGARRAQGYDAAYFGARASYIGGCGSTSCVMAARDFGIPASGTMAHSWVQMFPSEYEAFKKYADCTPTPACCWSIPIMCCATVCPMPSRYLTRSSSRWASAPRASASTPVISPTCPRRPARCWMRLATLTARSARPTAWTSTLSAI